MDPEVHPQHRAHGKIFLRPLNPRLLHAGLEYCTCLTHVRITMTPRRLIWTLLLVGVTSFGLLARGADDSDLADIKAQLQEIKKQYEERIENLEKRIDSLESD